MSKKGTEIFQTKITRNDRFAQMSHQEKVIEQKKKEIQARLEQKQKGIAPASETTKSSTSSSSSSSTNKGSKSPSKVPEKKPSFSFNIFSNDGSFLDQFKQMKEKKVDHKSKFKQKEGSSEKSYSEERNNKGTRWSQRREPPSPKDRPSKARVSRFDNKSNFEPKINISTTYTNLMSQGNFDVQQQINAENVTGQPLLKKMITTQTVTFPNLPEPATIIAAPPLLLNVPPPQVIPSQLLTNPGGIEPIMGPGSSVMTTVNLPPPTVINADVNVSQSNVLGVPPPCLPQIELSSIPPPNPIQVHNIPQPEPINALTIPHPAPLQVQNIPPPSPIQLNEIPNPKPLDLLNIPTPGENMTDTDFIKNVPPPNKSVPPPNLAENTINVNVALPPPQNAPTCIPPPNVMPPTSIPPPQTETILIHNIPPMPQTQTVLQINPSAQNIQQISVQGVPPPPQVTQTVIQNFAPPNSINLTLNQLPVAVVPPPPAVSMQNILPQTVLAQQPGMTIGPPPVNINCPPPILQNPPSQLQPPQITFVSQPPPITSQMPPMNIPPPPTQQLLAQQQPTLNVNDMNTVFPPGTPHYEAMASLGRMVAQCGPGIEDIVKQRKPQDPNLWFLFHKESAAYQQYQQLIKQFKMESSENYKPEDLYEPEMAIEEDARRMCNFSDKELNDDLASEKKRRRKSRWGDKETNIPPPTVLATPVASSAPPMTSTAGNVMISKITRTDPGLIQYVINTYGSTNIDEEDWKKAEDSFKINILYQDMVRKKNELEKLQQAGKNKYEYDSDEELDGGTWEHKLREKEMMATQLWAQELTRQAEGKHHIGDFLPPEELKKFMEKSNAVKEGRPPNISDYNEFKIKEDNIGFKMLQKFGWSEGQGLGSNASGIVEPINKATIREQNQGLGLDQPDSLDNDDDEYDAYRKRMMLAYRFRPNPLNNPRRPYY